MSDRLLNESDVLKIAFQLPYVVNSAFFDAVKALPSADKPKPWKEADDELYQEIKYDVQLTADSTLWVKTDKCKQVERVVIKEPDGKFFKVFFRSRR